ncbi:hypothetical protein X474_03660 [Dethiosulfatarculus sandiegensis]|uniref:Uncharacterized protein n=1 Tax=Dethiosulfatarculus sandiegensis TaxID=1429043 RepID=A0A0D2HYP1_9BACT|nr:hypothetical protein X474_03660 [Dethiosulfatarculus sandiegensis]
MLFPILPPYSLYRLKSYPAINLFFRLNIVKFFMIIKLKYAFIQPLNIQLIILINTIQH